MRKKIPLPPADSYLIACNKAKTLGLAKKLGIPIPKTTFPTRTNFEANLPFPVVVKPALGSGNVRMFYSDKEVQAYLKYGLHNAAELVIQERIRGDGYGFFALYKRGELQTYFMHKRIREIPPTGGPSTAAKSVYEPKLLELGSKILDTLAWHGVAMVEFKRDIETGEFKLMEINPKFWGSLDLAVASGVNFPYLAVCLVTSRELPARQTYKSLKYCWFPDDLYRAIETPSSLPSSFATGLTR